MNKNRKSKKSRRMFKDSPRRVTSIDKEVPPPFHPTVCSVHRFRFVANSAATVTITRKNLLNLLLVATSATSTVRVIEGIRLRRVNIWSNPVIGVGAAVPSPLQTAQLEWIGENSPSTVISDTTMGVRPLHLSTSPPPSASNRWWSMSGFQETDDLFSLILPAASIVDVSVDIRFVEQEAPTAGDTPAGATLGQMYGGYLDGIATALLTPIGLVLLP